MAEIRQEGGFSIPALSEEEFQRGEYGGFEDSGAQCGAIQWRESSQAGSGNWKGKSRARDPVQGEFTTAWERANTKGTTGEGYTGTAEADGAAVVSLLSSASFDTDFGGELEDLDPDAAPPPLTAEEIKLLDSFRRQVAQEASGTALPSQTQSSPAHLSSPASYLTLILSYNKMTRLHTLPRKSEHIGRVRRFPP